MAIMRMQPDLHSKRIAIAQTYMILPGDHMCGNIGGANILRLHIATPEWGRKKHSFNLGANRCKWDPCVKEVP